jgi:hypothetical protein
VHPGGRLDVDVVLGRFLEVAKTEFKGRSATGIGVDPRVVSEIGSDPRSSDATGVGGHWSSGCHFGTSVPKVREFLGAFARWSGRVWEFKEGNAKTIQKQEENIAPQGRFLRGWR